MRRGRAAHLFLSLLLPSDRASAIVGDLLEDTSVRRLRFWTHVATTASSLRNGRSDEEVVAGQPTHTLHRTRNERAPAGTRSRDMPLPMDGRAWRSVRVDAQVLPSEPRRCAMKRSGFHGRCGCSHG